MFVSLPDLSSFQSYHCCAKDNVSSVLQNLFTVNSVTILTSLMKGLLICASDYVVLGVGDAG